MNNLRQKITNYAAIFILFGIFMFSSKASDLNDSILTRTKIIDVSHNAMGAGSSSTMLLTEVILSVNGYNVSSMQITKEPEQKRKIYSRFIGNVEINNEHILDNSKRIVIIDEAQFMDESTNNLFDKTIPQCMIFNHLATYGDGSDWPLHEQYQNLLKHAVKFEIQPSKCMNCNEKNADYSVALYKNENRYIIDCGVHKVQEEGVNADKKWFWICKECRENFTKNTDIQRKLKQIFKKISDLNSDHGIIKITIQKDLLIECANSTTLRNFINLLSAEDEQCKKIRAVSRDICKACDIPYETFESTCKRLLQILDKNVLVQ